MNKPNLVLPINEQNLKTVQNKFQYFPFHLVEASPWPILLSFSLLNLTIGAVSYMHGFSSGGYILTLGFILTVYCMILWFRDIVIEGSYLGHHTKEVKNGLMIGVLLFIVSEVFAFLSVFWAFFHSSLSPAIELGGTWPPLGITPLDPFAIPLLNTFLLLSSGVFITYGHHALIAGNRKAAIDGVIFTIILAFVFTALQYYEYSEAGFTFADGVYGSAFYASTGLHGFHVIIGTLFIGVSLVRIINYQLTTKHHNGFESSILYWHFVDVVWLFLFVAVYFWGNT
uniref:Cytochrome c oxidase subunit 3 n=1 Tax=Gymnopilus junonius TaxID=109634 RepID=A0A890JF14_GYMJU|nr:cytochrome c oxidase subunit 3 [Gymnopilus junonius]QRH17744.1 cytochrome c oxidase subunit 3 [Gymnopilus junonius]